MSEYPRLSTLKTGLASRCPRCGKGPLFRGFLTIRDQCPNCGLDYGFADPADGPAFFVMSGMGILIMAVFAVIEVLYRPPIAFHFLVTLPMFVVACLGTLRPTKGWLVSEQYVHKAEEARFEHTGRHGPF